MAQAKKTLYDILGIARDANDIDVGLAYQRRTAELQRAAPPDPGAQSLLHEAYEVLANPKRRAAYDSSLVTAAEKAEAKEQQEPDLVLEGDEAPEEAPRNWVKPAIAVGALALIVIFFAIRPSHAPEAPKPEPAAEAPKPPPPPAPKPLTAEQILAAATRSVGLLMSYEMSGRAVPVGLAVAVEPAVMVATCHGISGGTQLVVKLGDESVSGNLTVTDEMLDLCRISAPGLVARPITLASDDAKPGDTIYVLGANAKGDLALTEGKVAKLRDSPATRVIEISTPIAATGSGGAVFDTFGRLVGIATTPHAYGAGLNIAIPSSAIAQMRSRERAAAK